MEEARRSMIIAMMSLITAVKTRSYCTPNINSVLLASSLCALVDRRPLLLSKQSVLCIWGMLVVTDVAAKASAPKVYPRVTLASASTHSGSVVRTLRDGE